MSLLSALFNHWRTIRTLDADDAERLQQWLEKTPAQSAFLLGWLSRYRLSDPTDSRFFEILAMGPEEDWSLIALHVHGALVAMVGENSSRAWHLGRFLVRKHARVTTLVGPDRAVSALAEAFTSETHTRPRFEQAQVVLLRTRGDALPLSDAPAAEQLEQATLHDWNDVLSATLAMHEEETGLVNLQRDREGFSRSTRQKIREQRVWIIRDEESGRLTFKASASLPADRVLQLEGIWTRPDVRRRGIALHALSVLCLDLHQEFENLSLYTSADNHSAIALYHRLGFRTQADWRTIYLD